MEFFCSVENPFNGVSLLNFLKSKLPSYSNKKIKSLLDLGCVTINGIVERFGSRKIFKNDAISFQEKKICKTQLEVLFEDDHFLAINKPSNFESSQKNLNKFFFNCFLVHRLDKNTTGILLAAKTKEFKKYLEHLFKSRKIHKKYTALVDGVLKKDQGKIVSYLKPKIKYHGQTIWASSFDNSKGLLAETHFKKIKTYSDFSIVSLTPITGRTHQIRVHLKELGHPILGDFQYCRRFKSTKNIASLCLHANQICFEHPITNVCMTINSPLPSIFF